MTPLVWSVGFAGAALLLLALAELGARWCIRLRARYYVWPPGARYDIRLSPDLSPPLEARVRFDVNRDGERGSDVRGADRGLYRILVAGGSPVESFLSDQATSWHGALERALATPESLRTLRAARVHVGNIGRSGVAAQELDLHVAARPVGARGADAAAAASLAPPARGLGARRRVDRGSPSDAGARC